MDSTGVRELKNNLSHYLRRVEKGERIAVTTHGRIVAELVPPGASTAARPNRYAELVATGVIRPAVKKGPLPKWRSLNLPPGTARALIDWSRGED
jgi:prevent-host-death family protein